MSMAEVLVLPGLLLAGLAVRSWRGRTCANRWHRSIRLGGQCPSCGQQALDAQDLLPDPHTHACPDADTASDAVPDSGFGGCDSATDGVDIDFD
jgi:hypothetical protein